MISVEYDGEYGFTVFDKQKFIKTIYMHDIINGETLEELKKFAYTHASDTFQTKVDIALSIISMSYLGGDKNYRPVLFPQSTEYLKKIDYNLPEHFDDVFEDVLANLTQQQQAAFWINAPQITD